MSEFEQESMNQVREYFSAMLPKDVVVKLKASTSDENTLRVVDEYLKSVNKRIHDDWRSLDILEVESKSLFLKTRVKIKELLSVYNSVMEDVDKEYESVVRSTSEFQSKALDALKNTNTRVNEVRQNINDLNSAIARIEAYNFEKLLDTLLKIEEVIKRSPEMKGLMVQYLNTK